jgi:16S rRNA processing protein RimM
MPMGTAILHLTAMDMRDEDRVTVGQILKPFGVRGQAKVRSLSDVPSRFENLQAVTLVSPTGRQLSTRVTGVHGGGESYIVAFEAFSNPEEVEVFRGSWVQIPGSHTPSLPTGQYYESDLIGLTVSLESGVALGILQEIWQAGGQHVFVVHGDRGEVLIPATREIITAVDIAHRSMTVREIEGLLPEKRGARAV